MKTFLIVGEEKAVPVTEAELSKILSMARAKLLDLKALEWDLPKGEDEEALKKIYALEFHLLP